MNEGSIEEDMQEFPFEEDEEERLPSKKRGRSEKKSSKSKKKRRIEEDEEEDGEMQMGPVAHPYEPVDDAEKRARNFLKGNLSKMIIKNPSLDLSDLKDERLGKMLKIDAMLDGMSTTQLETYFLRCREVVGLDHPGESAKHLVGLGGSFIAKRTGDVQIYHDLMEDHALHTTIESYLPTWWYMYLEGPAQIVHSLTQAVTKSYLNKQS